MKKEILFATSLTQDMRQIFLMNNLHVFLQSEFRENSSDVNNIMTAVSVNWYKLIIAKKKKKARKSNSF